MEQQRLDAPIFEFWYLVGDDLGQHLREFHAEGFIHKGVEADLEKALHHLRGEREGYILSTCYWRCTRFEI